MAKNKEIENHQYYQIEGFNNWLHDIGKKRKQYDSYINTLDDSCSLKKDITLKDAKNIVKALLNNIDNNIQQLKGTEKHTLQSKRSGLRAYQRYLSYIPSSTKTYKYNGIQGLAYLIEKTGYSLIKYMISHSLFVKKDLVRERANEIAKSIRDDEKIPARFSSSEKYTDSNGTPVRFNNRKDGVVETYKSDYYFDGIKIKIDENGNLFICKYLKDKTSIIISSGDPNRNCYGYMISHVWGRANNPLFFSNFWNIVLIPQYLSFILDKGDELASIKYAKDLYKAIAYQLYEESIDIIDQALKDKSKNLGIEKPKDDIMADAKKIIVKKIINYI